MYKNKNIHGFAKQTFQDMKKRKKESMNEIVTKNLSQSKFLFRTRNRYVK